MFSINIYLRFALMAGLTLIGIFLATMYGFWYAFPLFIIVLALILGYLFLGTVQSASKFMQVQDMEGARKRLAMTYFPKLLIGPGRSAYFMLKGAMAMQSKDYSSASALFKEGENSKYITDNEKAMLFMQQANVAALKNNYKEAAIILKKTEDLNVTEPMIKDQLKQFRQGLSKAPQMNMQNRMAAMNRGGTKQRRPKMR